MMLDLTIRFSLAAAHFLWEGAIVWGLVWLLSRALSRHPANRHALFLSAMLILALCLPLNFFLLGESSVSSTNSGAAVTESPSAPAGSIELVMETPGAVMAKPKTARTSDWTALAPLISGVYLAGLTLMLGRLGLSFRGANRLRRKSRAVADSEWLDALEQACRRLKIRTQPLLGWSTEIASPVIVGAIKPMILLPISLSLTVSTAQAESILAHELAHLRRLDPWFIVFQRIVETLLFFHPVIWWASRELTRAREEACDDLVIASGTNRADYAEALLLCSQVRLEANSMALAANGGGLRARLMRLLGRSEQEPAGTGRAGWIVLAGILAVAATTWFLVSRGSVESEFGLDPTASQRREVSSWVERWESGLSPSQEDEAVTKLVALGPEIAPRILPLLNSGKTDNLGLRVLEKLAPDPRVQELLVATIREERFSSRYCALLALGESGNREHAPFIGQYFEESALGSIFALQQLGGPASAEQLMRGFDIVPTEYWWVMAKSLGEVGEPRAIPTLKQRLAQVELPPSEKFPAATSSAFVRAIEKLESGTVSHSISHHTHTQGQRFRYPFADPDGPKIFTLDESGSRVVSVNIPDVDPNTDSGRKAIFAALGRSTSQAGFTIDGDDIVLFNGLSAAPLWPDGRPWPMAISDWLSETPQTQILGAVRAAQSTSAVERDPISGLNRVRIPEDGLLAAATRDDQVAILNLRRTSPDFSYHVHVQTLNPLLQLIAPKQDVNAEPMRFGRRWGLPLLNHHDEPKDGAIDLYENRRMKPTREVMENPGKRAILALEMDSARWALAVPQAKRFFMVESADVWESPARTIETLREATTGTPPLAKDQVMVREHNAAINGFTSFETGRTFAFALEMPESEPIAGVLQIEKLDPRESPAEARFLYQFLSTKAARSVFAD